MNKNPISVTGTIKINAYNVISDKISEGIDYGWMRAHKYTDSPDEQTIKEEIYNGVTNALGEILSYE